MSWLEIGSQVAEIGTAVTAITGVIWYSWTLRQKTKVLEKYLREEKNAKPRRYGGGDHGRRTVMHLIAHLKMTEDELLQAAFRSRKIETSPSTDPITNRAEGVYMEYKM